MNFSPGLARIYGYFVDFTATFLADPKRKTDQNLIS